MSDKRNDRPLNSRAFSTDDMELAIHGLDGIFTVLNWIDSGSLDDGFESQHLKEEQHSLVISGMLITEDLRRRF